MHTLKHIFLKLIRWIKRAWPETVPNDLETERLDRIRNPSKYLGKE